MSATPPLLCPACGKPVVQWYDMAKGACVQCPNPKQTCSDEIGQGPTHAAALEDLKKKLKTQSEK